MSRVTKNLDVIYAQRVHTPKVMGIPLYTRIDGNMETNGDGKIQGGSSQWNTKSKSVYTSPNNVRRVFLTHKGVGIQLYKPVAGLNNGAWLQSRIPDEDDAVDVTKRILGYNDDMRKYMMERNINKDAKEPNIYTITGTGLGALVKPWVCSNLEELYFDITPFLSSTIANSEFSVIHQAIIKNESIKMVDGMALKLFEYACKGQVKSIRSRFPRLKAVGFIQNLQDIIEHNQMEKGSSSLNSIENLASFWFDTDKNRALISRLGGINCIDTVTDGIDKYNTNFALRDGTYKFDNDVLKGYFDTYKKKVDKHLCVISSLSKASGEPINKVDEIEVIEIEREEKSSLEVIFDKVYVEDGPMAAKKLVILTFTDTSIVDIEQELKGMSTAGEIRYRAMINM